MLACLLACLPAPPPCRGFTPYLREDYLEWKREGRLVNDGVNAKARTCNALSWAGAAVVVWWWLGCCGLDSWLSGRVAALCALVLRA